MNRKINLRLGILSLLVFSVALSRLLPHPPNFTPVGAMGLFGAAYFSRKYLAFVVPFAAMWVSDLILNNAVYAPLYPEAYNGFSWFGNGWTYAAFGLIVLLGFNVLKKVNVPRLLGASLAASVLFFFITNFGSWLADPTYPKNVSGLLAAYTMGIPFFWNTLVGDLIFAALLFGAFELAQRRYPQLRLQSTMG